MKYSALESREKCPAKQICQCGAKGNWDGYCAFYKKQGRPKSAPTKVITFRVRLEHEQAVRKAVAKEVKRLKGNA